MKMAVFWVVPPCSVVKFTDVSEVLADSITDGKRRNVTEDSHFHTRRRENTKSHPLTDSIFTSFEMYYALQSKVTIKLRPLPFHKSGSPVS
jgi:hypothetical protein